MQRYSRPPAGISVVAMAVAASLAFAARIGAVANCAVSAAQGGEIGWRPERRIHPAIREVLPGLKLGETPEQVRGSLTEQLRAERAQAGTQ